MLFRLRPYQRDAQEAILRERDNGVRSQMVVMATGLGKCVDPETYVWSDGLRKFGELWGAEYIAGPHNLDKINAWYDDGINPGKKVSTHAGITIDGTLAHRVWIRRQDGFEGWCRLEDVRLGDYIGLARGRAHFGMEELLPTEALALGRAFRGDSSACHGERSVALQRGVEPQGSGRKPATAVLERTATPLFQLEPCGLPQQILCGTRETVRQFVLGLFDGDSLSFTTTNARIA